MVKVKEIAYVKKNDNYVNAGERYSQSGVTIGRGHGLSVRDHFAASALQGILASVHDPLWLPNRVVETAYKYADEMLEQREKGELNNG